MTIIKIKSTFFDSDSNSTFTETELTSENIIDSVREFIQSKCTSIFGGPQAEHILNLCVNGFFLFNLRKDKYMLKNKEELLKYCKDENVSFDEKMYFCEVFLYIQRPKFLSENEHEYIRSTGDLDGFDKMDDDEDEDDDEIPVVLGFAKPCKISDELAEFIGIEKGVEISRTNVSRKINEYVSKNRLQDPNSGRIINPDENLRKLLKLNDGDELTYFNLCRYVNRHFIK
jgi:hypothetical protein